MYSVTATATATGAATPATFTETNAAPTVFVFYVNGLENASANNQGVGYYAIAGAVAFDLSGVAFPDQNGNCGVQDYNDGYAITSPTGGDNISATGRSSFDMSCASVKIAQQKISGMAKRFLLRFIVISPFRLMAELL
jgi:hypothetical protein